MKVYIDSREQEKIQTIKTYWAGNRKKFPHIEAIETKLLATGDMSTSDGYVGIERKSKADFVASICEGKLKKQLYELNQNYHFAFLLVEDYEGIMDCILKNPHIHPNVIKGVTTSSVSHNRVPLYYVGNFYNSFVLEMINKFYDGKSKQYEKEYTPVRRAVTKDEELLNIIIGIDGIGMTEGSKLLQTFGNSISKIANASIEDLMKVERIGKTKAEHIKGILN